MPQWAQAASSHHVPFFTYVAQAKLWPGSIMNNTVLFPEELALPGGTEQPNPWRGSQVPCEISVVIAAEEDLRALGSPALLMQKVSLKGTVQDLGVQGKVMPG